MAVEQLDHVNIVTDRLGETADFYAALLELDRRDGPAPFRPDQMQWLFDASGRALVHLNSVDCDRAYDRVFERGAATGAVHHIAFKCTDHPAALARIRAMGCEYRTNRVESIGLDQIFVKDPNGVLLELNFFAG